MPVLGVCRGLQILNVAAGGTLHQDVPEHSRYDIPVVDHVHDVSISTGSRLAEIYGNSLGVNTLHHQTVDEVGSDLTVTATAPDGTVEGLEMVGRDVIAVQWHPEMLEGIDPVFAWLVERARSNMSS
jgi:putative glutamine amidotransferase